MGFFDKYRAPVGPAQADAVTRSNPVQPGGYIAPGDGYAAPTAPATGGAPSQQQIEAWAREFMAGKPSGPETMQGLKAFLESRGVQGIEVPTRGGGALSSDKLAIGGTVYDFLGDEGGANNFQMAHDGYWVGGRPSSTPGVWTDPNAGEFPGGGMFGGSLNGMGSGYLATPWRGSVGMPDPARMLESPSYKWNLSRGLDGLDKSHAARGTILSGGAGKDAMEFASGLASAEYDKDFNRGMQVADFNRGTHWGDTDRIFGRFNNLANTGLAAAGNFANNVSSIYQGQANANAENALNTGTNWGNLAGLGVDLLGGIFAGRGRG